MNSDSLNRIETIFAKYCTGKHFFLKDLRTGETYENGTRSRYPICSCFKFAVLVALFEKLDREPERVQETIEVIKQKGLQGTSVIDHFSDGAKMTFVHLAQLMMSLSDCGATDRIIEWVGLDSVEKALCRGTRNSRIFSNVSAMIEKVTLVPDHQKAKRIQWTETQAANFLDTISRFGYSNGEDLASLAKFACAKRFKTPEINTLYRQTLSIPRLMPKAETFLDSTLIYIGKTGSLIRRYFMNDCGVFLDPKSNEPIACFGYCSHGWQLPAFTCDSIGGLIGLEIARALGLNPNPNWDWTEQAEELFLGYQSSHHN